MIGGQLSLRPAQPADIPFIMATERIPGFEKLVGRWSEEDHLAALRTPGYAYLLGLNAAGERMTFAIIRGLHDAHGNVCLSVLLCLFPAVVRWVFTETEAYRLWLDVLADNGRARHVYLSPGFCRGGYVTQCLQADGQKPN
jgi:hypothetical protein